MIVMNCYFVFDVVAYNIGLFRAHSIFKELCSSCSDVGATAVDFKNWMRGIKIFIGKRNLDMIL